MWTEEDRIDVAVWQLEQRELCPGCRLPWDQTTDPARRNAWEAEAVRCFACETRAIEERKFSGAEGDPAGLRVVVFERLGG